MARWAGQVVVIVFGFVIPRLIDNSLGTESLGLWDLAWSTVSYFRFLGLGMAGGLNRYVARYTARGDTVSLSRAISSTTVLQTAFSTLTLIVGFVVAHYVPRLFDTIPADRMHDAQQLVRLLGATLALQMLFWPARGILTGRHQWAVNAGVTAFGDTVMLIGLMTMLWLGKGLASLGLVVLLTQIVTELLRLHFAGKAIAGTPVGLSWVESRMMKKMLVFGVKNNLGMSPGLIVHQTTSVLLAAAAGPATLALYARPLALFKLVQKLLSHYSILLTSTASSLQGLGHDEELKEFLLTSLKMSTAMALPAMISLATFGNVVIELWMGEHFVVPYLPATMAIGFTFSFASGPAIRILSGLNQHGRLAINALIATITIFTIGVFIANSVGWTPIVAAILAGASMTAGPGLLSVITACHRIGVPLWSYLTKSLLLPLLCNLPFLAVMIFARLYVYPKSFFAAVLVGTGAVVLTGVLYWHLLLDATTRANLKAKFSRKRRVKQAS